MGDPIQINGSNELPDHLNEEAALTPSGNLGGARDYHKPFPPAGSTSGQVVAFRTWYVVRGAFRKNLCGNLVSRALSLGEMVRGWRYSFANDRVTY